MNSRPDSLKGAWRDWTDTERRQFVEYVHRCKLEQPRGAVGKACAEYDVPQHNYFAWAKKFAVDGNGNGNGHAEGGNGGTETVRETAPTERIENTRRETLGGIRRLMDDADALAMQLEKKGHPLAEALGYAVLSVRAILEQLEHDGLVAEKTAGMTPREAMDVLRRALVDAATSILEPETSAAAPTTAVYVEPQPALERNAPPEAAPSAVEPPRAPTVAVPQPPVAAPPAPAPATVPAPVAVERRQTREEAFVKYIQIKFSVGVKEYRRAVEVTMSQGMQVFDRRNRNAGVAERMAYERHLQECIAAFDPNRDGDLWRFAGERLKTTVVAERGTPDLIDGIAATSVRKTKNRQLRLGDENKHHALLGWMRRHYECDPADIAEATAHVLERYKGEITILVARIDQSHATNASVETIVEALVSSVANSVWHFDPRINDDLDGYVRKGFRLSLERAFNIRDIV